MPSNESRMREVVEMIRPLGDVTSRKMMGEYLLYLDGTLFGGIYDDRLMLKITPSVKDAIPDTMYESPYPGAKKMAVADDVDRPMLMMLVPKICDELPVKRK